MTTDDLTRLKNKFCGTPEGLTRLEQQACLDEIERAHKLLADVGRMKGYVQQRADAIYDDAMKRGFESNERMISKADRLRLENKATR